MTTNRAMQIAANAVAPGFVETDMAAPYLHGPGGDGVRAPPPSITRLT